MFFLWHDTGHQEKKILGQTTGSNLYDMWIFRLLLWEKMLLFCYPLVKYSRYFSHYESLKRFCSFCPNSGSSLRSHSMNNLNDSDTYADQSESKSYGDVPPPATPNRRASVDFRPISPLPEKKGEEALETKPSQTRSYNEHPLPPPPPPPPPIQSVRRSSGDFRPISPLPDRKGGSASDVQVLHV